MNSEPVKIRLAPGQVTQAAWDQLCREAGLELGDSGWFHGGGLRAGCDRATATFAGQEAPRAAASFWLRFGGLVSVSSRLRASINEAIRERTCPPGSGMVLLDHFEWNRKMQEWVAWTHDAAIPLLALVGLTVNLGTKYGMVYEGATVTGFDALAGVLVIEGGMCGRPRFEPGEAESLDGPDKVRADDIARGYIHPASAS